MTKTIDQKLQDYEAKLELVKRHLDINYEYLTDIAFENELVKFVEKIDDAENTKQKIDNLGNEVNDLEDQIDDLEDQIDDLEDQIDDLEKENQQLKEKIDELIKNK